MPSPALCVLPSASPHGVSGAGVAPRAPIPAPPASQMPVRSRLGAGAAVPACGWFWPCASPELFHGRICPPTMVVSKSTATPAIRITRFGISRSSYVVSASGGPLRPPGGGHYGCAAGGGGAPRPPVPSVEPFGSTTLLSRPTGAPLFTGCSVTVTSSPNLNDVRAQPRRVMSVGLLTSTAQFRTPPVSSFASNFRKQCGFAQIHSVTVPLSVSSLVVSKLAAP